MSNFHPLFVPSELPSPLKEQALKYAQSKTFSKVGAGDGTDDQPKKLIQYGVVFMKSLRFNDLSTTKPDRLPFIPGIIPGVRSASPVRQFPEAEKGFRLLPLSGPFQTGPAGHNFPYMRRFDPAQGASVGGGTAGGVKLQPDEEGEDDVGAEFVTPPYSFPPVPYRYPFPAFL